MYRFPTISHHSRKPVFRPSLTVKRGGAFGPAQIKALSPAAWYRWGVGITVATGVSSWADQSGNGRDLLQATGGSQPTKQADNSILFDGVAQFLKSSFTLNQPETVYGLLQQVSWTSGNEIWSGGASDNTMDIRQTTGGASPSIAFPVAVDPTAANTNLAVGAYGVLVAVYNGASSLIQVNNTTPTTGDYGAANSGGITLGRQGTTAVRFSNIRVKEVIVFSGAHAPDVRRKIVGYLGRLGGVSV